ncbi:MAG: riboflavin synthase [Acidobacteriota bacterium]
MFTGIIEELGLIESFHNVGDGARIRVSAQKVVNNTEEGDSIAVNGVCLTALDVKADGFSADLSSETLARTTLGRIRPGTRVNLERALTAVSRLGGHIVQGHVDCRGKFLKAEGGGDFYAVRIGFPPQISRYIVPKGSIAVEGISLTVAALANDYFEVAIIPKTWQMTNLSSLVPGDDVNLEADIIAKYVERLAAGYLA